VSKQIEPDILVPDKQVRAEFGVTSMTMFRWDRDRDLGFPVKVQIRGRNFRSRRALEEFKTRMIGQAMKARASK
jgi:hypothetical protein